MAWKRGIEGLSGAIEMFSILIAVGATQMHLLTKTQMVHLKYTLLCASYLWKGNGKQKKSG